MQPSSANVLRPQLGNELPDLVSGGGLHKSVVDRRPTWARFSCQPLLAVHSRPVSPQHRKRAKTDSKQDRNAAIRSMVGTSGSPTQRLARCVWWVQGIANSMVDQRFGFDMVMNSGVAEGVTAGYKLLCEFDPHGSLHSMAAMMDLLKHVFTLDVGTFETFEKKLSQY